MLLRLDRLAENGFAARILFLHGAGRVFHVGEHSGLHRGGVGNYGTGFRVHLQQRAAAGTSNFESGGILRHLANIPQKRGTTLNG